MAIGNPIVLSVRNLTKTYRAAGEQIMVLRGVNLSVAAGERVALSGESGSGKSTLLHLIAGLDRPDGGEIRLADASISDLSDAGRAALRRDRLGLVFQQFNLIPSLDVEDNLVFQSRIAGRHARPPGKSPCGADPMTRVIWILAVLLSHWRRHPMQLATLLIGLISATALWSGVQALNQQARTSYDRAAAVFGGARTAMLVGRDSATFPRQLFVDLRRAGWPVSPVLEGRVQIGGRSFRLLGIEPVTIPADVGNAPAIGRAGLQSFVTPPGEMLVAPEVLADLNLPEGATPLASDGTLLPPLRVQAQLVPDVLVVDIGIAQRLLKMPDQVSRLLVGKAKGKRAPLENVAGDKLRLVEPDAESDLERLTDSFNLNLTAFGLLSFVVGLFIVNSAIGLAFEQRLPTLRTLRACGVYAGMLNAVLLVELVSLALVAGVIGLVCGYLIAASLLPDVAASLRGLYSAL